MRYLAFDIECCDGKHICEFGYVIADEKFNIIKKAVLTINPEMQFDLIGRPGSRDMCLFFTEEQYAKSPIFTTYYNEIKSLLEFPDQIIIGHAIGNDAFFLRTACQRYKLPPINFNFFDSQKAYGEYANIKRSISLEKAEKEMALEKPEMLHKSDDDALLSMRLVQTMCKNLEVTLEQLLDLCATSCGSTINHTIRYAGDSLPELLLSLEKDPASLSYGKKEKCIRKFNANIAPEGEIITSRFNGKKFCFGRNFEIENIKLALIIIQLLKNRNCSYIPKVTDADIYIATEEELLNPHEPHSRIMAAIQKYNGGGKIEILTFKDLYKSLNVTETEVKMMPIPHVEEKDGHEVLPKTYSTCKVDNTIGSILKAKGIDLSKI